MSRAAYRELILTENATSDRVARSIEDGRSH